MPNDLPSLFASVSQRNELERQTVVYITEASGMIVTARAVVESGDQTEAAEFHGDAFPLVVLLGRYQRFKHHAIFNPVIQRGLTSSAIVARGLKTECVLMGESFGNFHARWAYAELAPAWPAYRREMLDMCARLLDHLRLEREAIGKLLALSTLYQFPGPAAAAEPVRIMVN